MLPRKNFGKNGVIWGAPKYVISNLKINNFIAIFLSQINVDEYVSTKINTFRLYKGGLGGQPPPPQKQKKFKKKIKHNGGFSLIFLLFGKAP